MRGVPVLMYHALEDADHPSGASDPGERAYVLQLAQFREQMQYLKREGYQTLLLEECDGELPEKGVVITFDDGHRSNYTLALPILRELSFKAEFFITTGFIGKSHFLTGDQVRELALSGMGVGGHGVTHAFLDDLDAAAVQRELCGSRDALKPLTGRRVDSFSAPGGRLGRLARGGARQAGFRFLCTSRPGLFRGGGAAPAPSLVPRVALRSQVSLDQFKKMVQGSRSWYFRAGIRHLMLSALKQALGNGLYARWHGKLQGQGGRT